MLRKILSPIVAVCITLASNGVLALGETAGDISNQINENEINQVDSAINSRSLDVRKGSYGQSVVKSADIRVFGQQIFEGGFGGVRGDGLNPGYIVAPGDQVIFRAWGAINIDRVLPVDAQGNVFIPSIGPIAVAGGTQSELDGRVKTAVKSIYPKNVEVYTQLQGVQPVSVFVTGFVNRPGRYAGTPSDSILYFLNQAQGIDSSSGSYRNVKVKRGEQLVSEFDLYEFLTQGTLAPLQFKDGDTIVVERRGVTVVQVDEFDKSMRFELKTQFEYGREFLEYTAINANISHVLVQGTRNAKPFNKYLALKQFKKFKLHKDDSVSFKADKRSDTIIVNVEGSFLGKSNFILPKNAKLMELLNNIPVDADLTDVDSVSIRRISVAEKQKASLQASLDRLENAYLTASSSTAEEASIRVNEAELIQGFVKRAAEVEPNGRMVVATEDGVSDIRLQDGDVVTIPAKSDSILVGGQVLIPRAIVYQQGMSIDDYIKRSGGFTEQADEDKIVVIRQSGEVIMDASLAIRAGDEILVLPKVPTKNIQLATSITQILYQIAIAAKVALDL